MRVSARAGLMLAACVTLWPDPRAMAQPPAEPDFTLATIPTTLQLPRHKMAFRLTHRFLRTLGDGDFGDLASRLFGFDSGAQIGLEMRYGISERVQAGISRTSERTIRLFGQYRIRPQGPAPVAIDVAAGVEGLENFSEEFSPQAAVIASRALNDRATVYLEPAVVANTNLTATPDPGVTAMIGLGARVRASRTIYLFAESAPRIAGYRPGAHHLSFGVERRAGGHMFQLNFSNGFGTTPAQVARGGTAGDDWYIGFNLTRRFF
jgi:hypothetical protein